jgi:hypothetical protein
MPDHEASHVTRDEIARVFSGLDELGREIGEVSKSVAQTSASVGALAQTVNTINNRQSMLEQRQADSTRLNWAPIGIVSTVLFAIAGISGALIASTIGSESTARIVGDQHIKEILAERTATQNELVHHLEDKIDMTKEMLELRVNHVQSRLECLESTP